MASSVVAQSNLNYSPFSANAVSNNITPESSKTLHILSTPRKGLPEQPAKDIYVKTEQAGAKAGEVRISTEDFKSHNKKVNDVEKVEKIKCGVAESKGGDGMKSVRPSNPFAKSSSSNTQHTPSLFDSLKKMNGESTSKK